MDYLVVCAIVKNEARYIYEWLSYHHSIGVQRFYIYENGSTDDTIDVIRSWPYAHLVHIMYWPGHGMQHKAYEHFIDSRLQTAEWCAFIDVDEFLCPTRDISVHDTLRLLSPHCTALYVHWLIFGSSGLPDRDRGLVTESFVRRGHNNFAPNKLGKTVVKLRHALRPRGVHIMQSTGVMINDSLDVVDQFSDGYCVTISHRFLSLNHYFTKSLAEWRIRRSYGKADKTPDSPEYLRTEEQFALHDANDVEDLRARTIIQQCKPIYSLESS